MTVKSLPAPLLSVLSSTPSMEMSETTKGSSLHTAGFSHAESQGWKRRHICLLEFLLFPWGGHIIYSSGLSKVTEGSKRRSSSTGQVCRSNGKNKVALPLYLECAALLVNWFPPHENDFNILYIDALLGVYMLSCYDFLENWPSYYYAIPFFIPDNFLVLWLALPEIK